MNIYLENDVHYKMKSPEQVAHLLLEASFALLWYKYLKNLFIYKLMEDERTTPTPRNPPREV